MIIDATLSSFQTHLDKVERLNRAVVRKRSQNRFPAGFYDSKQEHDEFRQLYIREFLERNGQDADIDLTCTVVFWRDGEIAAVTSASSSTFDNSQNVAKLLAL